MGFYNRRESGWKGLFYMGIRASMDYWPSTSWFQTFSFSAVSIKWSSVSGALVIPWWLYIHRYSRESIALNGFHLFYRIPIISILDLPVLDCCQCMHTYVSESRQYAFIVVMSLLNDDESVGKVGGRIYRFVVPSPEHWKAKFD